MGLPSLAEDVGVHFSRLVRGIHASFLLAPGRFSAKDVTLGVPSFATPAADGGLLLEDLVEHFRVHFRSRLGWLGRREGEGGGGELGSDTDTFGPGAGYIDFFSVNHRDVQPYDPISWSP